VLYALAGLLAALASPEISAQSRLPPCPMIITPADAGYCQVIPVLPDVENLPETLRSDLALLAYNPDESNYLLTRQPLFAPGDVSLLSRRFDTLPQIDTDSDKMTVYSERDAEPGALQKAYDVPFFDGLALSNDSAISQSGSSDNENRAARSKFGLAYEEYGLTFKVDPDAAANWSDLAGSSSRRFGIDNSVSAMIADDLTLTLSTGYTTESSPGNPLSASSNERHRVAVAQHFASGYRLGASAQRRNEYTYGTERDLNILGLQIGVPLGETLNLTASHEFGLGEKRDLNTRNAVPLYGRRQNLDLQLHWTPAALASRAMTLMAGYTVTQDDMAGTADPYLTQARLNLAMRF
jgi:hypothetical protein